MASVSADPSHISSDPPDWNPRSGETSVGGKPIGIADQGFMEAIAAAESSAKGGALSAGMVAATVMNRGDEIASGQSNFLTRGDASPAGVISAPHSPADVLGELAKGEGMEPKVNGQNTQFSPVVDASFAEGPNPTPGTSKYGSETFNQSLANAFDPTVGFSDPGYAKAADRGALGTEVATAARSLGLDIGMGGTYFASGNNAATVMRGGGVATYVGDQSYATHPDEGTGKPSQAQIATTFAAAAVLAGIDLPESEQAKIEGFGATNAAIQAQAAVMAMESRLSLADRGFDSDPTAPGYDAMPGYVTNDYAGTMGAIGVPQISTDFDLAGNLTLGSLPGFSQQMGASLSNYGTQISPNAPLADLSNNYGYGNPNQVDADPGLPQSRENTVQRDMQSSINSFTPSEDVAKAMQSSIDSFSPSPTSSLTAPDITVTPSDNFGYGNPGQASPDTEKGGENYGYGNPNETAAATPDAPSLKDLGIDLGGVGGTPSLRGAPSGLESLGRDQRSDADIPETPSTSYASLDAPAGSRSSITGGAPLSLGAATLAPDLNNSYYGPVGGYAAPEKEGSDVSLPEDVSTEFASLNGTSLPSAIKGVDSDPSMGTTRSRSPTDMANAMLSANEKAAVEAAEAAKEAAEAEYAEAELGGKWGYGNQFEGNTIDPANEAVKGLDGDWGYGNPFQDRSDFSLPDSVPTSYSALGDVDFGTVGSLMPESRDAAPAASAPAASAPSPSASPFGNDVDWNAPHDAPWGDFFGEPGTTGGLQSAQSSSAPAEAAAPPEARSSSPSFNLGGFNPSTFEGPNLGTFGIGAGLGMSTPGTSVSWNGTPDITVGASSPATSQVETDSASQAPEPRSSTSSPGASPAPDVNRGAAPSYSPASYSAPEVALTEADVQRLESGMGGLLGGSQNASQAAVSGGLLSSLGGLFGGTDFAGDGNYGGAGMSPSVNGGGWTGQPGYASDFGLNYSNFDVGVPGGAPALGGQQSSVGANPQVSEAFDPSVLGDVNTAYASDFSPATFSGSDSFFEPNNDMGFAAATDSAQPSGGPPGGVAALAGMSESEALGGESGPGAGGQSPGTPVGQNAAAEGLAAVAESSVADAGALAQASETAAANGVFGENGGGFAGSVAGDPVGPDSGFAGSGETGFAGSGESGFAGSGEGGFAGSGEGSGVAGGGSEGNNSSGSSGESAGAGGGPDGPGDGGDGGSGW